MPDPDENLEELLMRWQACELTATEEATLAERLLHDPAARQALVFSFLLTGELERRLGIPRAKAALARAERERTGWGWWTAGLAAAAVAGVLMVAGLGLNGRERPAQGLAQGGNERHEPRDGPEAAPADEARIAALIAALGDEDPAKRDQADKDLRALGAAAEKQLAKAVEDPDAERSTRAKVILRGLQIAAVLKTADAGLLAAQDLQAEVEYNLNPRTQQKGAYRHAEGGRKYHWVLKQAANPASQVSKTVVCDGETVIALQEIEAAKAQKKYQTGYKASAAFAKDKDLAWHGVYSLGLPPVKVLALVRAGTRFDKLSADMVDGQKVWVLEGPIAPESVNGLSVGGARGGANSAPNGLTSAAGATVKRARLILPRDGGTACGAEGLTEDGTRLWEVKLAQISLTAKAESEAFKFTLPEGVRVIDLEAKQPVQGGPQVQDPNQGGNAR